MVESKGHGVRSRRRYAAFALMAFVPTMLLSLIVADMLWSRWQQPGERRVPALGDSFTLGLFQNDALTSPVRPIAEGLAIYIAMARTIAQRRLEQRIEADARREYKHLSGRSYPAESFAPQAWRHDPKAFEAEIARTAHDWGGVS